MVSSSVTRRNFLQAAGMGAAAVWTPKAVKGYTRTEMSTFASGGRLEVGISKWDLDTPALLVDLNKFEQNLKTMQTTVARNGIASRPHAKTHKCPAIARLQIDSGSVGICTAKVHETQALFEHGVKQLLCTHANVTPYKIRQAMNLRKRCESFIQAVDTEQNARELAEAAREAGIVADVVVDVDPGGHRTGITAGTPALALAQLVDQLPTLRLRGLLCYDGASQHVHGFEKRKAQTLNTMEASAETCLLMKRSGLNTEIFSGGGTGSYNIDHETSGFTDVQVGSYIFMDAQYLAIGSVDNGEVYSDFAPSLTILTTVVNAQHEGVATADAGAKACTINQPYPIVMGETGISYTGRSDEFGKIVYDNPSRVYKVGEKLELIVSHCDPVVNLYNEIYGIRNDRVEVIWPIAARGYSYSS